jgi:hypothetical protein
MRGEIAGAPLLKNLSADFRVAQREFEAALAANDFRRMDALWERMLLISEAFWQGASYGERAGRPGRLRVWRKVDP